MNNVTQSILGSSLAAIIEGQKINMVSLTAQALGTTMGDGLVEGINDKLQSKDKQASDAYEETKRNSVNNSGKNNAPSLGTNPNSLFAGSGNGQSSQGLNQANLYKQNLKSKVQLNDPDTVLDANGNVIEVEKRNPFPRVGNSAPKKEGFMVLLEEEFKEKMSEAVTYIGPMADKTGEVFKEMAKEYGEVAKQAFDEAEYYSSKAESIAMSGHGVEGIEKYMTYKGLSDSLYDVSANAAKTGMGLGLGSAAPYVVVGTELKSAYNKVQAAPPALRTEAEVKGYGGVVAGITLGFIGSRVGGPLAGVMFGVGGAVIWKAGVEYMYESNNELKTNESPKTW